MLGVERGGRRSGLGRRELEAGVRVVMMMGQRRMLEMRVKSRVSMKDIGRRALSGRRLSWMAPTRQAVWLANHRPRLAPCPWCRHGHSSNCGSHTLADGTHWLSGNLVKTWHQMAVGFWVVSGYGRCRMYPWQVDRGLRSIGSYVGSLNISQIGH